ncbi:hypothetical protein KQ51_01302 [Candidatus Izimaplasma bacterium HR1]|jgi:hypothetical protein|uniref:hypothetical protein n=1 Tax=Candidatus Izimoplasma sp. HR1 TaxID=1541959 RepID=UPI0004F5D6D4|nr:hypothetical protein KQ51_01302 [Candidatus Izimaplasma bacterium HR1]
MEWDTLLGSTYTSIAPIFLSFIFAFLPAKINALTNKDHFNRKTSKLMRITNIVYLVCLFLLFSVSSYIHQKAFHITVGVIFGLLALIIIVGKTGILKNKKQKNHYSITYGKEDNDNTIKMLNSKFKNIHIKSNADFAPTSISIEQEENIDDTFYLEKLESTEDLLEDLYAPNFQKRLYLFSLMYYSTLIIAPVMVYLAYIGQ